MMLTVDELLEATDRDSMPRSTLAEARDRALLEAAAGLSAFTTSEVVSKAAHTATQVHTSHPWYTTASLLLRLLHRGGHLRVVSAQGAKPYVYEWVTGPEDLDALRNAETPPADRLIGALEAEVNRLRVLAGEPPLAPAREAVPA